jgi:hypothetical protein
MTPNTTRRELTDVVDQSRWAGRLGNLVYRWIVTPAPIFSGEERCTSKFDESEVEPIPPLIDCADARELDDGVQP